jgi:hypothetical protein
MGRPRGWIASLIKRRASARPVLASDARCAAGRPPRTTAGLVPAGIRGTRSIREEFARRASPGAFVVVQLDLIPDTKGLGP